MGLTKEQRRQIEQQIIDHEKDYKEHRPAKIKLGDDQLEFKVEPNVMMPDKMASRRLSEYLFYRRELFTEKTVVDMGCGSGIQGIVMARFGARKVIFTDRCKWDGIEICFKDNSADNARALVPNFANRLRDGDLIFAEGDLFQGIEETTVHVIVFNHPFFSANPKKEFPGNSVVYSMLDPGDLINRFFKEARERYPDAMIVMPYFHLAGPINDPGIQALMQGYVPTTVSTFDVDAGLQNGPMSIYEFKLWEKLQRVDQTEYVKLKKVVKEEDSLVTLLRDNPAKETWQEPIPAGESTLVEEILNHRAILKVDWGEIFDEYDDEARDILFHQLLFSSLSRRVDKFLPTQGKHSILFVYYSQEGMRIGRGFYQANGLEDEQLNHEYDEFKEIVIRNNQFDLTKEILHELQRGELPSFGLHLHPGTFASIIDENAEGETCHFLESWINISFGKDHSELIAPSQQELSNESIFRLFLDSRGKTYNRETPTEFERKFFAVYLHEMKRILRKFAHVYLVPIHIDIAKSPIPVGSLIVCADSIVENEPIAEIIHMVSDFMTPIRLSEFNSQVFKHAIQSGVGTIMARNMSHNLGSHVLTTVATESTLESIHIKNSKNLYRYLQNRMDFIAQIATEFPQWTYPEWFVKLIIREFLNQKHILNYLAVSEGFGSGMIKLRIRKSKGGKTFDEIDLDKPTDDSLVAVPGGIVGNHAVYVILEDIIRNAAKHNHPHKATEKEVEQARSPLTITIDLWDNPDYEHVEITIWDDASKIEKDDSDDDLPENCNDGKGKPLHFEMNCKLTKGFIDLEGKLIKENWGLAEMRICSGYLQRESIKRIGAEGRKNLSIIKAKVIEDNEHYHLGYSFKIYKPKEVFILSKRIHNPLELRKYSVYAESMMRADTDFEFFVVDEVEDNEFLPELKKFIDATGEEKEKVHNVLKQRIELLPFRLFIVSDKIKKNLLSDFLRRRIALLTSSEFEELKKNLTSDVFEGVKKIEHFKLELYARWLKHLMESRNKQSVILSLRLSGKDAAQEGSIEANLFKNVGIKSAEKNQVLTLLGIEKLSESKEEKEKDWQLNDLPAYLSFVSTEVLAEGQTFTATENKIAYLRHGYYSAAGKAAYFENLSGNAIHFPLISHPPATEDSKYLKLKLLCQLIENGFVRIAICDERVSNSSLLESKDVQGYRFHKYLDAAGIVTVNKCKNWKIQSEKWLNELMDDGTITCSEENQQPFHRTVDVLIIHQGILDKLDMNSSEKTTWVNELKNKIPYVVVTSGRGKPEAVPANTKFLPFSTIESSLLSKPHHKFLLTSTLMNL